MQRKVTIGASNDPLELEADRVADQVLSAPAGSGVAHAASNIQAFSGDVHAPIEAAPASVHQTLASPGRPLDAALRQDMEQRFGYDFSAVRVHSGAVAEQSARDVNANAYAVGRDLVFGAGQFAPATAEGLRLVAHELTHVVQQSDPETRGPQQSETTPARAAISRAPAADVLHAQPTRRRKTEAHWEPEVEAETRSVHVKVGERVSLKFRVVNGNSAPSGTDFDWRGIRINESDAVSMVGFADRRGTRATLVVKGKTAGIAEVGTTLHFKTPGGQEDEESTPRVRVEVGSQFAAAQGELAQIEKLRGAGKEVSPSRETAAQQEATIAAQKETSKARGAGGSEISSILRNIGLDIAKIENARYRGYQDALTHLNLTQFDEKAQAGNVKSFVLSLIGNLAWALSGLIAITPVGLEATIATGLLAKYGPQIGEKMAEKLVPLLVQTRAVYTGRLATAVGVGGAMLAQFANGLPTGSEGGNVSAPLIQLQQKLNELNAGVFNALSRAVYSTLLQLIEFVPPEKDVDAQQFAGRLETGMRRMLFAGYYENGGATGNQVNPAVIQTDARNQLLRRLAVTTGQISGEKLVSTKIDEHGLGKLIAPAVQLVGGAKALELGDYELVVEQLRRAVWELGLEGVPKVDVDALRKDFAESDKVVLSARVTDGGIGITNAARGMGTDLVEFDPAGVFPWMKEVQSVELRKKDLRSAKIGKKGAVVYSAEQIRIRGRGYLGAQHMEDEYEQIQKGPVALSLIYKV